MYRYDRGTMHILSMRHRVRFFIGCSIASLMMLAALPFLTHAGFSGGVASAAISVSGGAIGGTGSSGSTGGTASLSGSSGSSISDDKHNNGYSAPASSGTAFSGAVAGGTASLSSKNGGGSSGAVGVSGSTGGTASLSSLSNGGSGAGANGYVQPSTPSVSLSNSTFSSNAVASIANYFNVSDKNLFVTSLVAPVVNAFSSIFTGQSSDNSNGYGGYIPGGASIPSSVTGSPSSLGQTVTTYTSTGQAVTTYTNNGNGSSIQPSTGFSDNQSAVTETAPSTLGIADSIAQSIGTFLNWIGPQSNTAPATTVNSSGGPDDRGTIVIFNPMVPRTTGNGSSATCVPGDCQAAVQNVQASTPAANQTVVGTDITNTAPAGNAGQQSSSGGAAINSSGSPDERAPLPDASNILQRIALFVSQVEQSVAAPASVNTNAGSNATPSSGADASRAGTVTYTSTGQKVITPASASGNAAGGNVPTVTNPVTAGTAANGVSPSAQQPTIDTTNGGWNNIVKTVNSGVQAISAWASPYINSGAAISPAASNVNDVLTQGVDENLVPTLGTSPDTQVQQQVVATPIDQLRYLADQAPELGISSAGIQKLQKDIAASGYTSEQLFNMTLKQAQGVSPEINADLNSLIDKQKIITTLGQKATDLSGVVLNPSGTTVAQVFGILTRDLNVTPPSTVTKTTTIPGSGGPIAINSTAVVASQNDTAVSHPSGSALGSVDTSPAGSFGWLTDTIGQIFTTSGAGVIVTNTNSSAQGAQQGGAAGNGNSVSADTSLLSGTSFSDIPVTLGVPQPTADLITNTTKVAAQAIQLSGGSVLPSADQISVIVSAYKGFIDTYPIAGSIANSINTLNPIAFMIGGSAADAKATQVAVARVYAQAATQYGDLFAGPTDGPGIANLITAQVKYENPWYDSRNSGTGAVGIAQFIPSTWETQFKTMLNAATDKAINGTPSEKQAATALLSHINTVAGQVVTGKSNQSVLNPMRSDPEIVAAVEAAHYSAPIAGKKNASGSQSLYNQFQQIESNLSAAGQVNNDGNPNNDISIAAIGQLEHFGTGYYTTLLTNPNKPINNVDPSVNFLKNNPAVGCSGSCTVFQAAQSITNNAAHGYNGLPSATADSLLGTTDTFGATGLKVDKNGIPINTTVVAVNKPSVPTGQALSNGTGAAKPQSNAGSNGGTNGTQPVPLATQVDPNSVPPLNPSGSGGAVADNSLNDTAGNNPISSFVASLAGQSGQSSGTNAAVQAIGYALGYALGNKGNASGQNVQADQGSNSTGSAFNLGTFVGSMLQSSITGGSGATFSSGLSGSIGGIFTTLLGNFISKVIATGGGPGTLSDQASNATDPLKSITSVTGGGTVSTSTKGGSASANDSSTVSGGGGAPAGSVTPLVAQLPDVSCTPNSVNANQSVTIMVVWTCYNSASANGIGFPMVNGLVHAQAQISTTTGSAWLTYGVQCSNGTARSCLVQVNQ
jgi:hypothetical protein